MDKEIEELRRQLREQRERADEADKERDREQQRAESERQRAESERQRAEFERQRAESEQQRANSERQRADQAEHQSRVTTLIEYLRESYRLVDLNIATESDKSLTSKGYITDPQSKYVPSTLCAWPDFLETQRKILGRLHSAFPADRRALESVGFLQGLGERVAGRRIANEKDLEHIQQSIIQEPVSKIINVLSSDGATLRHFNLGGGVVFDNHPNGLSDRGDEPSQRRARHEGHQLHADQVCVYKYDRRHPSCRALLYVVEHKPPHKLTMPHLRLGLRDMDIRAEVVNRITVPTNEDPGELFQYHADRIVAAAVSQTYHYMITGGLEYSYLSTGEGYVFFKIDWTRPHHLLFHLAEPRAEVEAHPEASIHCSALSQVLAFTLLALKSRPRGQDERRFAKEQSYTWAENYEVILRAIPVTERKQTPPPSAFEPRTSRGIDRSPPILRLRDSAPSCRPPSSGLTSDESPDDSDEDTRGQPDQKSPSLRRSNRPRQQEQQLASNRENVIESQPRQYCTQRCLLGLMNRYPLDQVCPNFLLHKGQGGEDMLHPHPLDHATWLRLLRQQLAQSLDAHVIPLGKQGARGAVFQVTLAAYGYTVIAKCTVPEFIEDLENEAAVYRRLRPLQGICVPVLLGAIHLEHPYEYDHRVRLVHMMLLSWAGEPVGVTEDAQTRFPAYQQDLAELLGAVHQLGVIHGDARAQHVLWCSETNGLMLIDFERATTLECLHPPNRATLPKRISGCNKERWRSLLVNDNRHSRPVVLNGRVHRPVGRIPSKRRDLIGPRLIEQIRSNIWGLDGDATERSGLQEDIQTSRQCLEVCKLMSDEVSSQKTPIIGDAVADGDSYQVVGTTFADMFKVGCHSWSGQGIYPAPIVTCSHAEARYLIEISMRFRT